MKRIYKYKLNYDQSQKVILPPDAKILAVGAQGDDIFIWAMVDPMDIPTSTRCIEIYGTGHDIPDTDLYVRNYLGTVHMRNGLVWHVFEKY